MCECVCLSWWVFFLVVFFAIFLGFFFSVAHYKCVLNEVKASRKTSRKKRAERTHTRAKSSLGCHCYLDWQPDTLYPTAPCTLPVSIISVVINSRRRRRRRQRRRLSWLCSSIFKISEALLICYLCARWLWMIMIYAQTQTHTQTHTHIHTHRHSKCSSNWSWSGSTLASARCMQTHRRWLRDTHSLSDVCHAAAS